MTALSKYRQTVAEKFPPLVIEFEDGIQVRILSAQAMEDEQVNAFDSAQKKLTSSDENEDYTAVKRDMVELLAVASDNPDAIRQNLGSESLGVLTLIYEDYTKTLIDATKSQGDSPVSDGS